MEATLPNRSALMARVKGKNTSPEMYVRQRLHRMGYRFRTHRADLPGSPDIVFIGRRKAIFVHGCFWHRHPDCSRTTTPKTHPDFWAAKFTANIARDAVALNALKESGWQTLVVWECECGKDMGFDERLVAFLGPPRMPFERLPPSNSRLGSKAAPIWFGHGPSRF